MRKTILIAIIFIATTSEISAPSEDSTYIITLSDMQNLSSNWDIMKPQDRVFLYHWFLSQSVETQARWLPDIFNTDKTIIFE